MQYTRIIRGRRTWIAIAGVALSISLSGCGQDFKRLKVYPVKGQLTYEGQAPAGAIVMLHPVDDTDPNRPRPTAKVEPDGSFVVKTYAPGDGAPAGQYKVTVQLRKFEEKDGGLVPGAYLVPERYARLDKTDLQIEVVPTATELPPITLRR